MIFTNLIYNYIVIHFKILNQPFCYNLTYSIF